MTQAADAALAAVKALAPADRQRFLRQLKDQGVLKRVHRGERKAERNRRIRKLHQQGLTPGQIGQREGMTRDAVRQVLRRGKEMGTLAECTDCGAE